MKFMPVVVWMVGFHLVAVIEEYLDRKSGVKFDADERGRNNCAWYLLVTFILLVLCGLGG